MKIPDWAAPRADEALRARVLGEIAAALGKVVDRDGLASVGVDLPAGCGIVLTRQGPSLSLELVPAMSAAALVALCGWKEARWTSPSMHGATWDLGVVVEVQPHATLTAPPKLGGWQVRPSSTEWPKSKEITPGGGPMGTRPVSEGDVVRFIRIG